MSKIAGASSGPVRPATSRTTSLGATLGEPGDEVEDHVHECVSAEHAQHRIDDPASGCLADRGDPPLYVEAFVGRDEADDEREDDAFSETDDQVPHRECRPELLHEEVRAVVEEECASDPSAE